MGLTLRGWWPSDKERANPLPPTKRPWDGPAIVVSNSTSKMPLLKLFLNLSMNQQGGAIRGKLPRKPLQHLRRPPLLLYRTNLLPPFLQVLNPQIGRASCRERGE